jgi:uncharacterized protein (TIGR00661 family)
VSNPLQKTILYAVLNWGLGHATRSVPIIHRLTQLGHRVIIASDGLALELLQKEFPKLDLINTEPYQVSYSTRAKNFNIKLALQIPNFIRAIAKEHLHCKKLCDKYNVDLIISDNRYGFYQKNIPSALICHQLRLLYPDHKLVESLVNFGYQRYLKRFTQLWVPDIPPPDNLSRDMSKLTWPNIYFIGIDSRLTLKPSKKIYDTLSILSGPEPQRSLLENEIIEKLSNVKGRHCIIRGSNTPMQEIKNDNIIRISLASTEEVNAQINQSELVICRAGYTSIMDMIVLKKSAILVPTPGQVEQEYLAESLSKKQWFQYQRQGAISLPKNSNYQVPDLETSYDYAFIEEFLSC